MAYRSVTLAPGETYVLPAGAQIISASDPNLISSQNNCANLENLEQLKCYRFTFGKDFDNNDEHPMDDAALQSLIISGVSYDISTSIMNPSSSWCPTVEDKFSLNVPGIVQYLDCALIDCYGGGGLTNDKRCEYRIDVTTIPSIAENMEIYMTGKAFANGLYIRPVEIECSPST